MSTEAGTLGRFAGNALLSGVAHATGLAGERQVERFMAWLALALAAACAATLALLAATYGRLKG